MQETAAPGTLGAVLYPDPSKALESERDWVALVRAVARGDQPALHALYERTHRPVFTLIMRLRPDRETAEALTLDVFVDVWRRALAYDPAQGTVLAWIMNLARARAVAAEPRQSRQSNEALRTALAALRPDERYEIEAAYFAALTRAEAVAAPDQPLGRVKTLHPLRAAQAARGASPATPKPTRARTPSSPAHTRCGRCRRAKCRPRKRTSPPARYASASWKCCCRSWRCSARGRRTCCARTDRCTTRLAHRIAAETGRAAGDAAPRRNGPSRRGKRSRPASPASCSRPTPRGTW